MLEMPQLVNRNCAYMIYSRKYMKVKLSIYTHVYAEV